MNNIAIHFVGVIGLIFAVFSLQINNRKKLLYMQITSNLVFIIYYYLLGAYSGCLMAAVTLVRNLVFAINKQKITTGWFFVLLIGILGFTGLSYKTPVDLLPMMGIMVYTFSLWANKMSLIRKGYISCSFLYLIYNILVGAYMAAISSMIEIFSALISIFRYDSKNKKLRK